MQDENEALHARLNSQEGDLVIAREALSESEQKLKDREKKQINFICSNTPTLDRMREKLNDPNVPDNKKTLISHHLNSITEAETLEEFDIATHNTEAFKRQSIKLKRGLFFFIGESETSGLGEKLLKEVDPYLSSLK